MSDQAERLRQLASKVKASAPALPRGKGFYLSVASGKGGVGKTNVVANLGCALAQKGAKVLALDADFGLANLDIVLNLNPSRNLGHLLRGEATAKEIIKEALPGFWVLPGASGIEKLADLDSQDRMRILAGLSSVTEEFDYVIIDNAAGIGRNVVGLCLAADEVLLVTDPQPTSLTDAYGLAKVLIQRNPEVTIKLLVNSASSATEGRHVFEKLNEVVKRFIGRDLSYAGHILRDDCVRRATLRQQPFVSLFPRAKASVCVDEIAALMGGADRQGRGPGFWNRFGEADAGGA